MASENNELIDQVAQYFGEASDRLSECAEELELTKDQIVAIRGNIQSLATKYNLSAHEISNLIFLITSVMGWETDIQKLEKGSLFDRSSGKE